MDPPTFMESRQGFKQLVAPTNHTFRRDKVRVVRQGTIEDYRCNTPGCSTKYHIHKDWFRIKGSCKHPANAVRVSVEKVVQEVSQLVKGDARISTRDARAQIASKLKNPIELMELQKMSTLTRRLNRVAKKAVTEDDNDTEFQFEQVLTSQNQPYVLSRIQEEENESIIFCSPNQLSILKRAKLWAMDGTFCTLPKPWKQLYIIHAVLGEEENVAAFPCCFVLMHRKTKKSYINIFSEISNHLDGHVPEAALIDQEMGVRSALERLFPGIQIFVCYFHLKQTFYRKITSLNLHKTYNTDIIIAHHLKSFAALAFLPPDDIPIGFEELQEHSPELKQALKKQGQRKEVIEFEDFIEKNYIGRVAGRQVFQI